MEDSLSTSLADALSDVTSDPTMAGTSAMAFLLIAGLGLLMALVYVPIRLFLTITARSRRLRLLQRIRRLRDELVQPIES
ncbi:MULTISPECIES: hypothetical protein [unclassified Synechococcus]|jgi:hypothetical protein|uniref:hypothetical protein n=1 Tax=unclassified Synechococcus TaxID=2626047 RepID=UPI000DBC24A8|nr:MULTISPECIES: hypothetical protein [unclassified Synechococcus]MCP9827570.1 hypothetical protein [Synechococcus sp. L2F]MCP9847209.1 hypothetical protein [Synechococcus sp. Lug-A]MCT0209283.1 hypothetical protein [Synechococcus sp. CS-1333]PZV20897.1 MAG: hypothetical protein DCF18_13235 [Cyanobium sp.]